jgi:hypothetical protein
MAANTVKVYSVGLQGPVGPSGSLASDNSGSFTITGSLNITGSVTSSFFTGSFYGDGSNLTGTKADTGSLATTGSNTFIGDQVFSGSLTITGSSAKMVSGLIEIDGKGTGESELGILQEGLRVFRGSSASDRNQNITINYQGGAGNIVAYETNANVPQLRIFLSSSTTSYTPMKFQVGVTSTSGSFNVTGSTTLSGSLYVSGGTTGSFTGSFTGNGAGLTGLVSSSYAVTASHALNAGGDAFPYTGSAIITGSTTLIGTVNQGVFNTVSGLYSFAQGSTNSATGFFAHAEGYSTIAGGNYSHTEGQETKANGNYAHSEGRLTTASADYSHAEGYNTQANSQYSHAEGWGTIASANYQHAEGTFNIIDSNALWVLGDGANSGARSNLIAAYTNILTISGSVYISGSGVFISVDSLPTTEPATSGQLWLSGSAGNSKYLMVRD